MARYVIILFLTALVTAVDQYTKYSIDASMSFYDSIQVTSFLNIVHVRNKGAAFGFLNNQDTQWQIWFFLATTLVALITIIYIAKKASAKEYTLFMALGFVVGGAIGNAFDRLTRGSVVDFLDVHVATWHWPAFNVADMAICLGAFLIAILTFASKEKNTRRVL